MDIESVTQWLARAREGESQALDHAYAALYEDLKSCARRQLRAGGGSFSATALVNETYLRISASKSFDPSDRRHLLGLCARVMRQVLVDHSRKLSAQKRGGAGVNVTLDPQLPASDGNLIDVLALDRALEQLSLIDVRLAQIVEWRYFGGYNEIDIANSLGITERTVQRGWRKARAFLLSELSGNDAAVG
jgi:RNA polymerase sigma factor (TIGR02999 family)